MTTTSEPAHVHTVSGLTRLIKLTLEEELRGVWVEGEISNYRKMSSGHAYFTLKDARAQISAVIFAGAGISQPWLADGASSVGWLHSWLMCSLRLNELLRRLSCFGGVIRFLVSGWVWW